MQQYTSIDYSPKLDIRNADALPRGTGCRFLLCLYVADQDGRGEYGETLVAKSWHRKKPYYRQGHAVVMFN